MLSEYYYICIPILLNTYLDYKSRARRLKYLPFVSNISSLATKKFIRLIWAILLKQHTSYSWFIFKGGNMIKAVIFDMDGLMVDTEPLYSKAMSQVAEKRGKSFTLDIKQKLMGRRAIESLTIFKEQLGLNESPEELLREREEIYGKLLAQNVTPMPGLFKLLDLLNKLDIRKAIASSSKRKWIELIIHKLGILDQFEIIVSGEEIKHGKPDPEIYLLTSKKLNLAPEECLVLEDALSGVASAKAAKMKCITVPNQFTQGLDFSNADLVVNSLEEIDETILRSNLE